MGDDLQALLRLNGTHRRARTYGVASDLLCAVLRTPVNLEGRQFVVFGVTLQAGEVKSLKVY